MVGVEIDGRRGQRGVDVGRSGRLVELLLGFDHFRGVARERREICVHCDDGRAKADIGTYGKDGRENPEG